MKKHSVWHRLPVRCRIVVRRCRLLFRKMNEVLVLVKSQAEHLVPLELRFYIPQHISSDQGLEVVFAYIMTYRYLDMKCTVQPTQEETPSDCLVIRRLYCGEKLLCQDYLLIQEQYVAEMSIVAVPIPEPILQE